MKGLKYLILSILIIAYVASCKKIEQLPPVPYIEFQSFKVFDTTDILGNDIKGGKLIFSFQDGDGNIGINADENYGSDTSNLFFTLYKKDNGIMKEVPENDLMRPSSYRIPYMEKTGQNKILKGKIAITFLYLFYSQADNDTIKYDFYLTDRDNNSSNISSTCEIPLSVNNTYKIQE